MSGRHRVVVGVEVLGADDCGCDGMAWSESQDKLDVLEMGR